MERPRVRNIGFLAHIDAGKTSVTEAVLLSSGSKRSAGSVDSGDTETDWMDLERERGITINAAATHCSWRDARIVILDTPGHVDFGAEVTRCLRVLDGVVVVVCAVAGVQAQTEAIWRACGRAGLPRLVFVNKMDRRGASLERVIADMRKKLGSVFLPLQAHSGGDDDAIVDLIGMKRIDAEGAATGRAEDSSGARRALLEALADLDDGVMADIVEGREPDEARLRSVVRSATLAGKAVPVLAGSAFRGPTVEALLDAVLDFLPAPEEARARIGSSPADGTPVPLKPLAEEPLSALVFKQEVFPDLGRLSYMRIFSGTIRPGSTVWNASVGRKERIVSLFRMRANRSESIPEASAGDIVAASGLKEAETGHSLCDQKRPVLHEAIGFASPVVSVALECRSRSDLQDLSAAIAELCRQDPSLKAEEEPDTGRIKLSGQGELHLEIAVSRLAREYGQRPRVGRPEVSFRATIGRPVRGEARFDREIDYKRHFAALSLALSPAERGEGIVERVALESVRPAYRPLVEAALRGARQALDSGVGLGYPAADVVVELTGMEADPGDSSVLAFEAAGSMAIRTALSDAKPIILEPWMRLDVGLPEEALGLVAQALTGRQGRIETIEDVPGGKVVSAYVAMRALFGLAGELRSHARGRIDLSHTFHSYQPALRDFRDR